jgi:RHS repeat-associated protein
LYYVCTDRQGSITALLNPNGSVAEKYSYDAYGRRRNPLVWTDYNVPAPSLINRGYTGHEHLDGFGLINMNGRMYDPVIGRVLSPDKVVQAPGYTQSYNRYSYCMNNPLRYTDPSGYTYYDGMKSLYNYEGGGFWYRGSYQQNTADGWVSWTQGFSGGNGGWSTGATPLHYSPAPGSEGYTNIDDKSFIDNGTGNIVPFDDVKTNFIQPNSEYVVLLFAGPPDDPYQIYTGYRVDKNSSAYLHTNAAQPGGGTKFYESNVRFIPESIPYNSFAAGAINTQKSTYNAYKEKGLNSIEGKLLMHEFGHFLQDKYGGSLWYDVNVIPTSVYNINTLDDYTYNRTWTEVQANTMAYYYFGYPSFWDFNEYPININYISDKLKSTLYYHLP